MLFLLILILLILFLLGFIFCHCNPQLVFILLFVNYRILFFYPKGYFRYVFLVDRILVAGFVFVFQGFLVLLVVGGSADCLGDMCQGLFDNLLQFILVYSFSILILRLIIVIAILVHQLLLFIPIKLLIIHLSKLIKLLYRLLFLNLLVLAYLLFLLTFVLFLFNHYAIFLFYFYTNWFLLLFLVTDALDLVSNLDLKYCWPLTSIVYVLLSKFKKLFQYLQSLIRLPEALFNQNLFLIIYRYFHFYCLFSFFTHSFYESFNSLIHSCALIIP